VRSKIEGDLVFTACDTLWTANPALWEDEEPRYSWVGVAPIPAGTPVARWCRVVPYARGIFVERIEDKTPRTTPDAYCWTALARITDTDLDAFWSGLRNADTRAGEVQLSSGLDAIIASGQPIVLNHVDWLDVGDEEAYRAAQAQFGTYDPVKPGQATYVLPSTGRVVKFHANGQKIANRINRARRLTAMLVPPPIDETPLEGMLAFPYVPGTVGYDVLRYEENTPFTKLLLEWWRSYFWDIRHTVDRPSNWHELVVRFYRDKTLERISALPRELQSIALDAVTRVDWDWLAEGAVIGSFHGDLTYANVVLTDGGDIIGLDWREDFAGSVTASDLRYDLAKLLGSTKFHWQDARIGDFRHWEQGAREAQLIRQFVLDLGLDGVDVEQLAALTLINSAPLHAAPMNEILVMRGAHWLGQLT
jgi:hypothetical protein